MPTKLAALLRGMSWWCNSGDGSLATCLHHGLAGADLGSYEMVEFRLFQSICPTIKYQYGKANVVADALSRSHHKLEEGSMDDSVVATVVIKV